MYDIAKVILQQFHEFIFLWFQLAKTIMRSLTPSGSEEVKLELATAGALCSYILLTGNQNSAKRTPTLSLRLSKSQQIVDARHVITISHVAAVVS